MAFWENIDYGAIMGYVAFWLEFVFGLLILGVLSMVFFSASKYNKKVLIEEERAGGSRFRMGKAKQIKIGDANAYELLEGNILHVLKRNKPILQSTPENSVIGSMGKNDFLIIRKIANNQYRYIGVKGMKHSEYLKKIAEETNENYKPILQANPKPKLEPIDEDVLDWHFQKQKQLLEKHKKPNTWDKYGQQIMWIMIIVISFIIMIYTLDKAGTITGACESAKSNILDVVRQKI